MRRRRLRAAGAQRGHLNASSKARGAEAHALLSSLAHLALPWRAPYTVTTHWLSSAVEPLRLQLFARTPPSLDTSSQLGVMVPSSSCAVACASRAGCQDRPCMIVAFSCFDCASVR